MDDVFGNCSGDTVMEADLSRVLANLHQDIADLQYLQQQAMAPKQSKGTVEVEWKQEMARPVPQPRSQSSSLRHTQSEVVSKVLQTTRPRASSTGATTHHHNYQQYPQPRPHHGYVNFRPHLNNQRRHSERPVSSYDNVPAVPAAQPHAQDTMDMFELSKVSHFSQQQPIFVAPPPPSITCMQPPQSATFMPPSRSVSVMPPPTSTSNPPAHLPAQSATKNSTCHSSTPHMTGQRYMNVPLPTVGLSPVPPPTPSGGGSNSAPATPSHGSAQNRIHHSYIELWSGAREERDSLSDSECEELKKSFQEPQTPSTRASVGYVEMSSPYIKSPQVNTSFTGTVLADFASRLASYAGHQPRNIFCPFCPRYFGYEKSLSSHIHKAHRAELNAMVETGCRDVKLQLCPICQAQFFNTAVLPKHLIDFHRASVVEILEKNKCILSDSVGIQCPFCSKKVPHGKTGEQVLLYHMQQLHLSQYEDMINTRFKPISRVSLDSLDSLTGSGEVATFHPGVTSTPGLSNKLATLVVRSHTRRSVEALNLDSTWSSHTGNISTPLQQPKPAPANPQTAPQQGQEGEQKADKLLTSSVSKGILRHQSALGRKPSVKRELRFSVPPVTSEEVFIPESPEQTTPERCEQQQPQQISQEQQQEKTCTDRPQRTIPVRIDSLSSADFLDLNDKTSGQRKRRRLGLGLRSRKAFKKKDKENYSELTGGVGRMVDGAKKCITEGQPPAKGPVVATTTTRTFRRPKPVSIPRVPQLPPASDRATAGIVDGSQQAVMCREGEAENAGSETSPFIHLKLYSPIRMFRCNSCRVKFCDNESLSHHITTRHRGLLCILRPMYSCGVCSAKFFENKYLVKHCLQHHTSLLEIRSPGKHKTNIFRFTQD